MVLLLQIGIALAKTVSTRDKINKDEENKSNQKFNKATAANGIKTTDNRRKDQHRDNKPNEFNYELHGEYLLSLSDGAGEGYGFAEDADGVHFFMPADDGFIGGILRGEDDMIVIDQDTLQGGLGFYEDRGYLTRFHGILLADIDDIPIEDPGVDLVPLAGKAEPDRQAEEDGEGVLHLLQHGASRRKVFQSGSGGRSGCRQGI